MIRFFLTSIFLVSFTITGFCANLDSLRLEKEGEHYFIIHQVDEKETLYSLSRRYGVPIPKILEQNPEAKSGLGIGEILKIPYIPREKEENGEIHIVKTSETLFFISKLYNVTVDDLIKWNNLNSNALNVGQKLIVTAGGSPQMPAHAGDSIFHIVKASETLYAISRQYEVQVLEIRQWNNIVNNSISLGQRLFVGMRRGNNNVVAAPSNETEIIPEVSDVIQVEKVEPPKAQPPIAKVEKEPEEVVYVGRTGPETVTNSSGYTRLVENGMGGIIEGSEDNKKYLALHKTAKIGTIMQVRNEMNNKVVFVRVLGRLPDTGANEGMLIRLSKAAYDRLGAIDKKFRVEISYVP